jgi:uncharacterized membrane protein
VSAPTSEAGLEAANALDLTIARILTIGSYVGVGLLIVGVGLMVAVGRSPLDQPTHGFDPGLIIGDIVAGRPDGPLWVGLLILLVTPASRVAASLVGYLRSGERQMAIVSLAILGVIAVGVVVGVVLGTPTAG